MQGVDNIMLRPHPLDVRTCALDKELPQAILVALYK